MRVFKNTPDWKWAAAAFGIGMTAALLGFSEMPLPFFRPETQVQAPIPERSIDEKMEVWIQESYRICSDHALPCVEARVLRGQERRFLDGKTETELKTLYAEADGWQADWKEGQVLFKRVQEGLCPYHGGMWHLGVSDARLVAVYVGPQAVGRMGGLLTETDIRVDPLPLEIQSRLRSGSMVFTDYDEMIGVLDSLSD